MKIKTIKEVEGLLKTEEGFLELTKYCQSIFLYFDNVHVKMVNREITNGELADEYLDKVTGYAGFLRPVFESLETYKIGKKDSKYIEELDSHEEKEEKKAIKDQKKFVSAVAERKSSKEVQFIRKLKNAVKAYVIQADKDMYSLKAKLDYYKIITPREIKEE